jgi:hypothetical protein
MEGKDVQIILKCSEKTERREKILNSKRTRLKKDLAYKKLMNSTKAEYIINVGKYLYKSRCDWKNRIKKLELKDDEVGDYISRGVIRLR